MRGVLALSAPEGGARWSVEIERQTRLGRNKQSSHPARPRSSHLPATPIFAIVAVANIGGNGVP
jgi:hypothetical protein